MTEVIPRAAFSSLPAELRLQIADYALEQLPNAGLIRKRVPSRGFSPDSRSRRAFWCLCIDPSYSAASNLSILLVCRQFRADFTRLAFERTTFSLLAHPVRVIADQTGSLLRIVRKLVLQCRWSYIAFWDTQPFNTEGIDLDELVVSVIGGFDALQLSRLLRRLRNIKVLKFIPDETTDWEISVEYNRLVGAILKEDHYRRYDAPKAPELESTWWEWNYNKEDNYFILKAQEPKPIMEEEAYMILMKPKVDEVMERMERES